MTKKYRTYPLSTTEPLLGAGIARSHRSKRQRLALGKALHAGTIPVCKFTVAQSAFIAGVPLPELRDALNAEKQKRATPSKPLSENRLRATIRAAGEERAWAALVAEIETGKANGMAVGSTH